MDYNTLYSKFIKLVSDDFADISSSGASPCASSPSQLADGLIVSYLLKHDSQVVSSAIEHLVLIREAKEKEEEQSDSSPSVEERKKKNGLVVKRETPLRNLFLTIFSGVSALSLIVYRILEAFL